MFAQAYQRMIGGNKTGKDAISQLMDDMKKGRVKSDILLQAGQIASERAQPSLGAASRASQAEQARFQNVTSDMAILASNRGVEEGFARIFRTLADGLRESDELIGRLAEGFNEATKFADDLLLFPQSFIRALEGRDSLVADWLGVDAVNKMNEDLKLLYKTFQDLNSLVESGNFMPTLKSTAQEIAAITGFFGNTVRWFKSASGAADIVQADIASRGTSPTSNALASFGGSLAGLSTFVSTPWSAEGADMYRAQIEQNYPRGAQFMSDKAELQNRLSGVTNTFQIELNVDPVTLANMDVAGQAQALADQFRMELESTMLQFPVKE
ncbi:hypothetical protein D3C85_173420 [compost metagenome]